jgi:hypothetical protein
VWDSELLDNVGVKPFHTDNKCLCKYVIINYRDQFATCLKTTWCRQTQGHNEADSPYFISESGKHGSNRLLQWPSGLSCGSWSVEQ